MGPKTSRYAATVSRNVGSGPSSSSCSPGAPFLALVFGEWWTYWPNAREQNE